MQQVYVNGILVNAKRFDKHSAFIEYKEAERLLKTVMTLGFSIYCPGKTEDLTINSLEHFKEESDVEFEIKSICDSELEENSSLKADAEVVGITCIAAIEAQLRRLGGYVDFEEPNIREWFVKEKLLSLTTLFLNSKGEAEIISSRGTKSLFSNFINGSITIEQLLTLHKTLESMEGLNIHTVEWGQMYNEFFPAQMSRNIGINDSHLKHN